MVRPKRVKYDVSENCTICDAPAVNPARRNLREGVCLNTDRTNAILTANKFNKDAVNKGIAQPILTKQDTLCYSRVGRRFEDNVTNAAKCIIDWKVNGMPTTAERYLSMYHSDVIPFLREHHNIGPSRASISGISFQPPSTSQDDCDESIFASDTEESSTDIDDGETAVASTIARRRQGRSRILSLISGMEGARIPKKKSLIAIVMCLKTHLKLTDRQTRQLLNILRHEKPEGDWAALPKDPRTIGRPARRFLRNFRIRKVDEGLITRDQPRIHPLARGLPKKNTIKKDGGDVADFSIQDSLFLKGPGMVYAKKHRHLMQRLNKAHPNLLSPELLRIADATQFAMEQGYGLLANRPKMNCFSLKVFMDGVQIAKNSSRAQAIPVLGAIDSIAAYDPCTKEISKENRARIPIRLAKPFIITIYHGVKKPDQFQFLEKFFDEVAFLSPTRQLLPDEHRQCVVTIRCMVCDTPMISWATG